MKNVAIYHTEYVHSTDDMWKDLRWSGEPAEIMAAAGEPCDVKASGRECVKPRSSDLS